MSHKDTRWAVVHGLYNSAIAPLSLSQFEQTMGISAYYFKFEKIKTVTKSKAIHGLCDRGMALIMEINASKKVAS